MNPLATAARRLSVLPIERRVADVCPGCGGHAEQNLGLRLGLLQEGGRARCARCGIEKVVEAGFVARDPGIGKLVKSEAYGKGVASETPHLGRFQILKRTDGRFAVFEEGAGGGPVFDDVNAAKWRVWWRVEGEKATGVRLGEACSVGGAPAELVDFVDARRAAVRFLGTGQVSFVLLVELQSV